MKEKQADVFPPSRLFIYYNERVIEHTVNEDSGAMIRDGIKSVSKDGAPARNALAVRYLDVQDQTERGRVQGRVEASRDSLSAPDADSSIS